MVWAIAWKDILDAVKNRYLLMSLILPLGLSVMFRLLFGAGSGLGILQVAVFDPGGSRLTAQLRAADGLEVVAVDSEEQLLEEVESDAVGGLAIPEGFDEAVDLGQQPRLMVYENRGKSGGEAAAFREVLYQQVWALREGSEPAEIVWLEANAETANAPEKKLQDEGFRMDTYLLVMFLIMSLTMTGCYVVPLLLVEEKEKHTMEFLLVSPLAPAEIAAGKALAGLAYSILGAAVLIVLNRGWAGDWPLTFLGVIVGALFLVMVGLLMGSLMSTMMQINTWSTIVMMLLLAPSWLGVLRLPAFLDALLRVIPTYYLVAVFYQSFGRHNDPTGAIGNLAIVAACMAVAFGIVVWLIRRQEA
jgi:ABC-2 type transport system permease protein